LPLSESLFNNSRQVIPGGVNSPVRYYSPYPIFISSAKGSKIVTADHNTFTDYCMGYGALIMGHAHSEIIEAVKTQLDRGTLYCMPTEQELEMAKLLSDLIPNAERVRLMNTGTEATLHAIRLARAITKNRRIVKFDGCYHGSYDDVLLSAGSGAAEVQNMNGQINRKEISNTTSLFQFNDIESVENMMKNYDDIACVIVEPVPANMGLIIPKHEFLSKLRKVTSENNIILIFDEVVTGFRLSIGGASEYLGIQSDLSTFGKAIGNGFPLSAVTGRKEIMEQLSPSGNVYQGSTYAGNPVSVRAGLATVRALRKESSSIYPKMSRMCDSIVNAIVDELSHNNSSCRVNHIGSMFQVFFTDKEVQNACDVRTSNKEHYKQLFDNLIKSKVFVPPSQFETCFLSAAHTEEDIDQTIEAFASALSQVT
jgi:glutamate-1-semialdehyde 2,1-aminomutase